MKREGKFSIMFAASRYDVLVVEEAPRGQLVPEPEPTDAEVDAVLDVPSWSRHRAAVADDDVFASIFGDTHASTPEQAKELGW